MGKFGDWLSGKLSGLWSGVKDIGSKVGSVAGWIKNTAGKIADIPILGTIAKKAYEMLPAPVREGISTGLDVAKNLGDAVGSADKYVRGGIGAIGKMIPFSSGGKANLS